MFAELFSLRYECVEHSPHSANAVASCQCKKLLLFVHCLVVGCARERYSTRIPDCLTQCANFFFFLPVVAWSRSRCCLTFATMTMIMMRCKSTSAENDDVNRGPVSRICIETYCRIRFLLSKKKQKKVDRVYGREGKRPSNKNSFHFFELILFQRFL